MKNLIPIERQMLLAQVYHYAWYDAQVYIELQEYIKKWEDKCHIKAVFSNQINQDDTTNTGA
jgi:hypothetical protein